MLSLELSCTIIIPKNSFISETNLGGGGDRYMVTVSPLSEVVSYMLIVEVTRTINQTDFCQKLAR